MGIKNLVKGYKKFIDTAFIELKDEFIDLVDNGQKPEVLFIACCDSRVAPDIVFNTKPGDLFVLRNIGNFVPPNSSKGHNSVSAAIEYAVSVLNVKDIIVCGHTHCGACASLYQDLSGEKNLQHVNKWLELGEKIKEYVSIATAGDDDEENKLRITEKISIKFQLENLLTYPEISRRIKKKELNIHGWHYDIKHGSIEYYDVDTFSFKKL